MTYTLMLVDPNQRLCKSTLILEATMQTWMEICESMNENSVDWMDGTAYNWFNLTRGVNRDIHSMMDGIGCLDLQKTLADNPNIVRICASVAHAHAKNKIRPDDDADNLFFEFE